MNILITGGAGFIGSHLQDKLVAMGHEVVIVDNLRSGKKDYLSPQAHFYEVDIRDKAGLETVFAQTKPEAIFHLAAQNEVPYSMNHPQEDQEINIVGMMNLLDLAVKYGLQKFVYSNTGGALYGEVAEVDLPITEDCPVVRPTSFYGVSKLCAEYYLKLYGNLYHLPWVSLRYANVYGPRQDGNREAGIVAIFCSKLLKGEQPIINGDGQHTRDYIFVGDVVDANTAALAYDQSDYFNIATGLETSNQAVFDAIESHLKTGIQPAYGPDRPGDPRHNSLSPAKAKRLLRWGAKIDFKGGVKTTLDYYLQTR